MTVTNVETTTPALRNMLLPIGLILVAASYIGSVLAVRFLSAPNKECWEEPCQNEGVDNTIIMWASDFFVAGLAFLLGGHLHFGKVSTRRSGTLAMIFVSGSFTLMGILHWMYPNNGTTDNLGMMEYWVVWAIASFFLTLSASCHAYLAMDVTRDNTAESSKPPAACELLLVRLALAGVILSCISNLVGCVWCAWTPILHTTDMNDNFDAENLGFSDQHTCIQIVSVSETLLWYCYALLWVPMGILFRSAAKKKTERILGLATPMAALLAVLSQWTTGSMYFVAVHFTAWIRQAMDMSDERFLELWKRVYGAEIFHLGIILTMYCVHNLSWSLTIPPQSSRRPQQTEQTQEHHVVGGRGDCASTTSTHDSKQVRFAGEEEPTAVDVENGEMQYQQDNDFSSVGSASAAAGDHYILPATQEPRPFVTETSSTLTDEREQDDRETERDDPLSLSKESPAPKDDDGEEGDAQAVSPEVK